MPTLNEEFFDALVRHQVYLTRVAGSLAQRVNKLLDATEADIEAAILRRLGDTKGFDALSARRLRVLERIIKSIRAGAWDKVDELWASELKDLATYEPDFTARLLQVHAPVVVDMIIPAAATLREIARATPMEGHTLADWASRQRKADLNRIMGEVRVGMVQGEDSRKIARRVVGTTQMHKRDGVTQITRREAEAITRTAVNSISNSTRRELFKDNADLFEVEVFIATLDSRTTPICRANDGKRFKVGVGPMPPLHFNCRSTRAAAVDGQVLGDRPQKPATEQMLVREFAKKNGLDDVSKREDLPRGSKTAYDQYAAKRVRQLVGTVPAKTTYQEWLARQSAQFQDDVLGKTRGALFRRGGLELDRFVDTKGDLIPLSVLKTREAAAFARIEED